MQEQDNKEKNLLFGDPGVRIHSSYSGPPFIGKVVKGNLFTYDDGSAKSEISNSSSGTAFATPALSRSNTPPPPPTNSPITSPLPPSSRDSPITQSEKKFETQEFDNQVRGNFVRQWQIVLGVSSTIQMCSFFKPTSDWMGQLLNYIPNALNPVKVISPSLLGFCLALTPVLWKKLIKQIFQIFFGLF